MSIANLGTLLDSQHVCEHIVHILKIVRRAVFLVGDLYYPAQLLSCPRARQMPTWSRIQLGPTAANRAHLDLVAVWKRLDLVAVWKCSSLSCSQVRVPYDALNEWGVHF